MQVSRKPRLLWASVYCLLDTSSGASMAVRQMLLQLSAHGYELAVLGATVFDSERGTAGLLGSWPSVQARRHTVVTLADGSLHHQLYVTAQTGRPQMSCREESAWLALYRQTLDGFKPDLVFFLGGQPLDLLIPYEARVRALPSVFYLANGQYAQSRWCRDVDLVLTDSRATAQLYQERQQVRPVPVGAFIETSKVLATSHARKRLLFVNPRPEKGMHIVARLAMLLNERRPELVLEVVESRGQWVQALRCASGASNASSASHSPCDSLPNVVVTPNSPDMRPVYGRARVLLAPSLWWESAGRVLVEAMLNGIPALITDCGGMPETLGDAGFVLSFDADIYKPPYTRVPSDAALEPLLRHIEALFDDERLYADYSARARRMAETAHSLDANTARLLAALEPLAARRAGDSDPGPQLRAWHKHGLDDRGPARLAHGNEAKEQRQTQAMAEAEAEAVVRAPRRGTP
jgi:glycosyltransferase involved in cell wall biosynthesis